MYSVTVETTNSTTQYGANISSTKRLHEFLCGMDLQLVTKLEVRYYREVKNPHDLTVMTDTGAQAIVSIINSGSDTWEVSTPESKDLVKKLTAIE